MNFIQKKIHHLRQQSEEVKLRAISRFTIVAGIILVIAWAGIFLPLQLRFRSAGSNEPADNQADSQVEQTDASPQPTLPPRPTATPRAGETSIKLVPTSEDKASPSISQVVPVEVSP